MFTETLPPILSIALPVPLGDCFEYACLLPGELPARGSRVVVDFAGRRLVGVVLEQVTQPETAMDKIKPVLLVLDPQPVLSEALLRLLEAAARYYHHPLGEVIAAALPGKLRSEEALDSADHEFWIAVTGEIPAELERAPAQLACLMQIRAQGEQGMSREALQQRLGKSPTPALKALQARSLITAERRPWLDAPDVPHSPAPPLNDEQLQAVSMLAGLSGGFGVCLLQGVTGSGKTEVYLNVIEGVLQRGQQVLVIAPEISLTPQLQQRFQARFGRGVTILHSGLNDSERLLAWRAAATGHARLVVGTRSAVFAEFAALGLIIVDEEHDGSLKQQEGFRYHARDLAVLRASQAGFPVLLGSATPALESLYNVEQGRYQLAQLTRRAGSARPPRLHLVDIRRQQLAEGLSRELIERMREQLKRGQQVLLFLNRRGYTPILLCGDCGEAVDCPHCDAHTTWHATLHQLRCHHCGFSARPPACCPSCGAAELQAFGLGTQKIEQVVRGLFPNEPVIRIDRDSMSRKNSLDEALAAIGRGEYRVIIGTQMLAKGHDFPNITLVGILDVDQGLFSSDFRATERLLQQIVQVSGRAGRAEQAGEVVLQTHQPEHPLLQALLHKPYEALASTLAAERRQAWWPPYTYLALFRAAAREREQAQQWLERVRDVCRQYGNREVELLGPVTAPMERRAGLYRQQLLLRVSVRGELHRLLGQVLPLLRDDKAGRRVRWSVDVDPQDLT